jgi:hypothetical protein
MSFLVGPDGRIRYQVVGEIDWTQDRVRKAIAAMLPRESPPTQPRAALSASSR